jgi:hypothetical protein
MKTKTITIRKAAFTKGTKNYKANNLQIEFRNQTGYLWAVYGNADAHSDITLTVRGLRGSLPIACCATEYDHLNVRPLITSAIIEIKSVQRAEMLARVVARNTSDTNRDVVIGVIFAIE